MRVDRWFAFVDLSGFTAYGDQHGDEESVRVLTLFRSVVRQVATDFGVRIAKWLGDGCMLVSVEPSLLVASVCRLEQLMHEFELPLEMHVGMAGGAVMLVEGDDYTGRCVNLAARLAGVADPTEVLSTPELAEFAPPGTAVEPAGMISVAGLHAPVEVVRVGLAAERARAFLSESGASLGATVRAMAAYETIEFERDGSIGWLRLNRPERLNSFTIAMWREMRVLGQGLRDDPELRAVVVTGNGRVFSSGIDTTVFTSGGSDAIEEGADAGTRHSDPTVDGILRTQEAFSWLAEACYPTIAAVRGYVLGAGLQLALACDVRVFARGTQVGLLEHKYGILPDLGGTQRLPRVVGASKAKELIWTAARIDADEAYRIGLCDRLVDEADLDSEATALAASIAAQPPLAVQGAKRAVDASDRLGVAEGLVFEAEQQSVCLRSADMREAIAALVESRAPDYKGR